MHDLLVISRGITPVGADEFPGLMAQAQAGSTSARERLLLITVPALAALVAREAPRLGYDAEDALSLSVIATIERALPAYRFDRGPGLAGWLALASRVARNELRRPARWRHHGRLCGRALDHDTPDSAAQNHQRQREQAEACGCLLSRLLAVMPCRRRQVFTLCYGLAGNKPAARAAEVARACGLSRSTVYREVSRVRAALRAATDAQDLDVALQ